MKKRDWIFISLFLIGGLLTRFFLLDNRPTHHDEAVNGWFVQQIDKEGFFKYNPENFHGPLYFYLLKGAETLGGKNISSLRSVPVVASTLALIAFMFFTSIRGLKLRSLVGLGWLLSPAAVFYGRYAIHESLFALFLLLMTLGAVEFLEKENKKGLWWFFAGFIGAATNKETFVLTLALIFLSAILFYRNKRSLIVRHQTSIIYGCGLSLLLIFLVFSGFGRNPNGVLDFFKAFMPWMKTGTGSSGHEKSFWYWTNLLWQYEPLTLLGLILSIWGLWQKKTELKFLSFIGLGSWFVYSLIPYKTPWCILSFQWSLILIAAYSLSEIGNYVGGHSSYVKKLVLLICFAIQWPVTNKINFQVPIDLNHPYVYVHSTYETKTFEENLRYSKMNFKTDSVQIATAESWPFVWTLNYISQVQFKSAAQGVEPQIAVLLIDEKDYAMTVPQLKGAYFMATFVVRDARERAILFLRSDLFEKPFGLEFKLREF